MTNKTPLYDLHLANHAKMVDFAGWLMPLHYGSQLNEHHSVRRHAGIFDVSHMGIIDVQGEEAEAYLSYLLANNVERLTGGDAMYSCMLNTDGSVLDDLIVYKLAKDQFRIIVNAGTRTKDWDWMTQQAKNFACELLQLKDYAILAVQGPNALKLLPSLLPNDILRTQASALKPFKVCTHRDWLVARTGYTGEHGFEIVLPAQSAVDFFQCLLQAGIPPIGLGARDTLRLEAGLNLYGADMDESVSPLESNLEWTIAWLPEYRQFIGKEALLLKNLHGVSHKLVGLILKTHGVLRAHHTLWLNEELLGEVTSGGFSPTLNCSIAFARIKNISIEKDIFVDIRGKKLPIQLVTLPFVRHGETCLPQELIDGVKQL